MICVLSYVLTESINLIRSIKQVDQNLFLNEFQNSKQPKYF